MNEWRGYHYILWCHFEPELPAPVFFDPAAEKQDQNETKPEKNTLKNKKKQKLTNVGLQGMITIP